MTSWILYCLRSARHAPLHLFDIVAAKLLDVLGFALVAVLGFVVEGFLFGALLFDAVVADWALRNVLVGDDIIGRSVDLRHMRGRPCAVAITFGQKFLRDGHGIGPRNRLGCGGRCVFCVGRPVRGRLSAAESAIVPPDASATIISAAPSAAVSSASCVARDFGGFGRDRVVPGGPALFGAPAVAVAAMAAAAPLRASFVLLVLVRLRFVLEQCLPVGDGNLVIVGMDFGEGEEPVPVAAIIDERRLQRRFDARDFCEIDVAAKLFLVGGFEVEIFDAVTAEQHHPCFFGMGCVDEHFVGHRRLFANGQATCRRARASSNERCGGDRARRPCRA